jgi:hypothetical protein
MSKNLFEIIWQMDLAKSMAEGSDRKYGIDYLVNIKKDIIQFEKASA